MEPEASIPNPPGEQDLESAQGSPLLRAFIGEKTDRYLEMFQKVEGGGVSWNWASFLCGIGWVAYRKMYTEAWIIGGVLAAVTLVEEVLRVPESVSSGLTYGIWAAFGVLGNTLYHRKVTRELACIQREASSEEEAATMATSRGGTHMGFGLLAVGLFVAGIFGLLFGVYTLFPDYFNEV